MVSGNCIWQYFQQIFDHKNMKDLIQGFMNIYLGISGKEAEGTNQVFLKFH